MGRYDVDPHYRVFQQALERAIASYDEPGVSSLTRKAQRERFLARQEEQYNELIELENKFRAMLIASKAGREVYEHFVSYICDTRRNILDARPYFRERQERFSEVISVALRRRRAAALHPYAINYRFVQFAIARLNRAPGSPYNKLARRLHEVREALIVLNLPLAISRAKTFWNRTPKSHLSQMDLIQFAYEGEAAGIDKFVPPYTKMLRGVMIGRMTGNFIEAYSDTLVKFWPGDRRKLYRANKLVGRSVGPVDYDKLAADINEQAVDDQVSQRTTAAEISALMAAASTVSASTPVSGHADEDDDGSVADHFAAPPSWQPDVAVERGESLGAVAAVVRTLPLVDQKLIALMGVDLSAFAT